MRLLLDSHVPADVAAAVLKLKPSWSVEHVSSWQEGVWRNVDDDLLLEACHEDRRVLVSKDRRTLPHWVALRASEGKDHSGILFYDGQAFMVPKKNEVKKTAQLNGATICVEKGTTHVQNLADFFDARGMKVTPLIVDSAADVASAFFAGRCSAYTSDASQLVAMRLRAPGGPQSFDILSERISKEPLGPVVRRGDDDWFTLIRWVLFVLIAAEEADVTQDNIIAILKETHDPVLRRVFGSDSGFGKALGVGDDWAVQAVKAAGNYGEMFERNVGNSSALKLDRGLNRLWTQGGLMYAPPLR